MPANELKCVMVVDEAMPQGIIANSTAVMGVTIGKLDRLSSPRNHRISHPDLKRQS